MELTQFSNYSIVLMLVLLFWAVVWVFLSIIRIKQGKQKIFWQTNLAWNLVNVAIAAVSLARISPSISVSEANNLVEFVGVNIFLDIGYLAVAALLAHSSSNSKKQIGSAIAIQGLFLLILDIVIVLLLKPMI